MEEIMMAMMMIRTSEKNHPIISDPTWKLYENPFYNSQHLQQKQEQKQIHRIHLPISARKIAASFWDLAFIRPFMESELDFARAQIVELKAELQHERKARKKTECVNKRLGKEISEERKGRESLERVCKELAKEVTTGRAEIKRMKREMEDERKMLRVAEVLREERVQMKLNEAKHLLEDKLLELEAIKHNRHVATKTTIHSSTKCVPVNDGISHSMSIQRKVSAEAENPHIKRGIKGFVEFPKVVQAIGSKSRHLGNKLEYQKAQLMILLKQKAPIRSNRLIMS